MEEDHNEKRDLYRSGKSDEPESDKLGKSRETEREEKIRKKSEARESRH